MSEWHPKVVRIDKPERVQNSDTLSMIYVDGGYPVVFKTDSFHEGQLVGYVPIDSVMPDTPEWEFLGKHKRIRAKRFCGQFSMGMLAPLPEGEYEVDQDVTDILGLTKYEPLVEFSAGSCVKDLGLVSKYTDIEGFRKFSDIFEEGEEVVLLEKVHGCNARAMWLDGKLHIGSKNMMKEHPGDSHWSQVVGKYGLEDKFRRYEGHTFYYEIYGRSIQGDKFKYGVKDCDVIFFDIAVNDRYLNWDDALKIFNELELRVVPEIYRGPMQFELISERNGPSMVPGATNIREGFVIKPLVECVHRKIGRKILKFVGEEYQLLK